MKRTPEYIWLAVTADEYELPIAIADTARELGDIIGLTKDAVHSSELKGLSGHLTGRRIVKVRTN